MSMTHGLDDLKRASVARRIDDIELKIRTHPKRVCAHTNRQKKV